MPGHTPICLMMRRWSINTRTTGAKQSKGEGPSVAFNCAKTATNRYQREFAYD
jgi:hypothetical protein